MTHNLTCLAACLLLLSAGGISRADVPDPVLDAQSQRVAAVAKAVKASISVFGQSGQDGGSGVVVTPDGYAFSNFHVTKPVGNYMKCSLPDGRLYDAVIVGVDPTGDVSLIQLLGRDDFPHAELADSDDVQIGDWCFAAGNPFLLATDFQPTVTYGLVSGVHRYQYPAGTLLEYTDCIQTDAAINPGNSGGPLFNARGQLIGINGRGSFEKRGRVNVGVGYAISVNQIKNFMGCLRSGRIVDHATLGATVSTGDDGRATVTNILESSDAYRRGLRYGDEIVSFGGRPIHTANGLKNVLGIYPKGWRLPLSYRRQGQRFDCLVRLAGVHAEEELIAKVQQNPMSPKPPDQDKRGEKPGPGDKKPGVPLPIEQPTAPASMPRHVADRFAARRGFANYFYNQLNRQRVWKGFTDHGDFTDAMGTWQMTGELTDGSDIHIALSEHEVLARLRMSEVRIDTSKDLDFQLQPDGSGGLFVALHLWQRLLTASPTKFGKVFYLGTAPIPGQENLVDVLVATHNVIQTHFYFDTGTGLLVGLEMFPERDADPCEVYLSDYRETGGALLPHYLEIRYGENVFGVITVKEWKLPEPMEDSA